MVIVGLRGPPHAVVDDAGAFPTQTVAPASTPAPPPPPLPRPVLVEAPGSIASPGLRQGAQSARASKLARAQAPVLVIAEAVGGTPVVRKALVRSLSGSLPSFDVRARAESGYALTLGIDDEERADAVTLRCTASLALLPKKNVLASFRARADAEGEGTPVDELADDAAQACGRELGQDVSAWLRAHP